MQNILKRLGEEASEQSSRKGFLGTVAKAAIALTTAGLALSTASERAAASGAPLYCCTDTPCTNNVCPAGDGVAWEWYCCDYSSCYKYRCIDCYTNNGLGVYDCTQVVLSNLAGCAC